MEERIGFQIQDILEKVEGKILDICYFDSDSANGYNNLVKNAEACMVIKDFEAKGFNFKDLIFCASDFEEGGLRLNDKKSEVLVSVNEFGEQFESEYRLKALINSGVKIIIAEIFTEFFLKIAAETDLILIEVKFYTINSLVGGVMYREEIKIKHEVDTDFKIKIFFEKEDKKFGNMVIQKAYNSGLNFKAYTVRGVRKTRYN